MEKSLVAIVPCGSYEEAKVDSAVRRGIAALGGIGRFVKKEEKILLKPNFLSPAEEEKVITTHPSVMKAVCRLLAEAGYTDVSLGDSPANGSCRAALEKLKLREEDLFGVRVADMSEEREVSFPEGSVCRKFHFCREVTEADAIIGLCKMKTHALERITGGVKNMYGLVCGRRKASGHVSYPTATDFAKMLTDIHRATPQRLHLMDAVTAMEGNGPASGTPVKMGLLLVSADPVALDTVFCWLTDLLPQLVPTNVQGKLAGIGTFEEDEIELVLAEEGGTRPIGKEELVRSYGNPDFKVQRRKEKLSPLSVLSRLRGEKRRPVIDPEKCVKCGICVNHCPVEGGAVNFKNGKDAPPVYDYKKCIRCYCCQELCPRKAIGVKGRRS